MGATTSEWWASVGPRKVKSITYKEAQRRRRDGKASEIQYCVGWATLHTRVSFIIILSLKNSETIFLWKYETEVWKIIIIYHRLKPYIIHSSY
jgi:hypothetical protein